MRQINDYRPVGYAGRIALVACAMSMFVATAPAAAIELTPHRAIYELSLASIRGVGNIVDAGGAVSLEWSESCDGWTVDSTLPPRPIVRGERRRRDDDHLFQFRRQGRAQLPLQ